MKLSKLLLPTLVLTGLASSCASITACGNSESTSECTVTFQEATGYKLEGNTSFKVKKGTKFGDIQNKPTVKVVSSHYTWTNTWSLNDNDVIEQNVLVTAIVESDEVAVKYSVSDNCDAPSIEKSYVNEDLKLTIKVKNNKALTSETFIRINDKSYYLYTDVRIQFEYLDTENDSTRTYNIVIDKSLITNKNVFIQFTAGDKVNPTNIAVGGIASEMQCDIACQPTFSFAPTNCTERTITCSTDKTNILDITDEKAGSFTTRLPSSDEETAKFIVTSDASKKTFSTTVKVKRPSTFKQDVPTTQEQEEGEYLPYWVGPWVNGIKQNTNYIFTIENKGNFPKTNYGFRFQPVQIQETNPRFAAGKTEISYTKDGTNWTTLKDGAGFSVTTKDTDGKIYAKITDTEIAKATKIIITVLTQNNFKDWTGSYLFEYGIYPE